MELLGLWRWLLLAALAALTTAFAPETLGPANFTDATKHLRDKSNVKLWLAQGDAMALPYEVIGLTSKARSKIPVCKTRMSRAHAVANTLVACRTCRQNLRSLDHQTRLPPTRRHSPHILRSHRHRTRTYRCLQSSCHKGRCCCYFLEHPGRILRI